MFIRFCFQENGKGSKFSDKNVNSQKRNVDDKKNGYVSSMFRNNPQVSIPVFNKQIDKEAVNKNKNSLFSTTTYKDLTDLHPHMVCDLIFKIFSINNRNLLTGF